MDYRNKYLIDVTTIITYISDITNDPDLRDKIPKDNDLRKDIFTQIEDETNDPVMERLKHIFINNDIFVTKMTIGRTSEIIQFSGSESEKKRIQEISNLVKIIDDDPSDLFKNQVGKCWTTINKNVFGTADKYKMKLLTGNTKCVLFVKNELDCELEIIVHRSRCFVGKKYPGI